MLVSSEWCTTLLRLHASELFCVVVDLLMAMFLVDHFFFGCQEAVQLHGHICSQLPASGRIVVRRSR